MGFYISHFTYFLFCLTLPQNIIAHNISHRHRLHFTRFARRIERSFHNLFSFFDLLMYPFFWYCVSANNRRIFTPYGINEHYSLSARNFYVIEPGIQVGSYSSPLNIQKGRVLWREMATPPLHAYIRIYRLALIIYLFYIRFPYKEDLYMACTPKGVGGRLCEYFKPSLIAHAHYWVK